MVLICESETDGKLFVAVDEGALVKTGPDVLMSVRGAEVVAHCGTADKLCDEDREVIVDIAKGALSPCHIS